MNRGPSSVSIRARVLAGLLVGAAAGALGPLAASVGEQSGNHPEPAADTSWIRTDERAAVVGFFDSSVTQVDPLENRYGLWVWSRKTRLVEAGREPRGRREGLILLARYDSQGGPPTVWRGELDDVNTFVVTPTGAARINATVREDTGSTCTMNVVINGTPMMDKYISPNADERVGDILKETMSGSCAEDVVSGSWGRLWTRIDRRSSDDPAPDDRLIPGGIITIAGVREEGYAGNGGPARWAHLGYPREVAGGPDGSVVFIDHNGIRRIRPDKTIDVFPQGTTCEWSDDFPDPASTLCWPAGLAFGPDGTLYVSDAGADVVRRFSPSGQHLGTLTSPRSAEEPGSTNRNGPAGLAVDDSGRIFVAERHANRVRRIDPGGTVTVVAGNGSCDGPNEDGRLAVESSVCGPSDLAVAPDGTLYVVESPARRIRRISGGVATTVVQGPAYPSPQLGQQSGYWVSVAVDATGRLYGLDAAGYVYRFVDGSPVPVAGNVSRLPLDGFPALMAGLLGPAAIAFDRDGRLLIVESDGQAIRLADVGSAGA